MNLKEHQRLLAAIDKAFQILFTAKEVLETKTNKLADQDAILKLESEWQDSLEVYNDFFRLTITS